MTKIKTDITQWFATLPTAEQLELIRQAQAQAQADVERIALTFGGNQQVSYTTIAKQVTTNN